MIFHPESGFKFAVVNLWAISGGKLNASAHALMSSNKPHGSFHDSQINDGICSRQRQEQLEESTGIGSSSADRKWRDDNSWMKAGVHA